mmetsp:Transcript_33451/g.84585  ORF Transcript_33451/g.84585 Transcript_33451/m.84585 type:complete len:235 (-) Transcript_33451:76-780(-)
MVKCVPGTFMGATSPSSGLHHALTRSATSSLPWNVSAWNSRTIFSAAVSESGTVCHVSAVLRTAMRACKRSPSFLPPSPDNSVLYHFVVSCTCSREARMAGLSTLRAAASRSDGSAREISSSASTYLEPSGTVCDSKAKLSARPVVAKVLPTSWAPSPPKCLGSINATKLTCAPCSSATLAISRQTAAPKEWPAKQYGPLGCCLRTSSKKTLAKSVNVAGHSERGRAPFGHDSP